MVGSYRIIRALKRNSQPVLQRQHLHDAESDLKKKLGRHSKSSPPPSYIQKKGNGMETAYKAEECAPLKDLPPYPEYEADFGANVTTNKTVINSHINKNGISAEKTNFGYIANGHVHPKNNLSGNDIEFG